MAASLNCLLKRYHSAEQNDPMTALIKIEKSCIPHLSCWLKKFLAHLSRKCSKVSYCVQSLSSIHCPFFFWYLINPMVLLEHNLMPSSKIAWRVLVLWTKWPLKFKLEKNLLDLIYSWAAGKLKIIVAQMFLIRPSGKIAQRAPLRKTKLWPEPQSLKKVNL